MDTLIKISCIACLVILSATLSRAENVIFIVNEKNGIDKLSKDQVNAYYFKKVRNWPDGNPVRFFDRTPESAERTIFLSEFLKKSPRDLEEFWIGQKLYTGNSAPSQLSSDNLMKSMVIRFPGAIGYVGPNFPITEGIKKIKITEDY